MTTEPLTRQKYYIKDKASINGKSDLSNNFISAKTTCTTVFEGAEHDAAILKFFRINPEFISLQKQKNQKKHSKNHNTPIKKILKIF